MQTCAIVVLYNPDPDLLEKLLKATIPQIDGLAIIDNQPCANRHFLTLPTHMKTVLLEQASNIGLAAAQNLGIDWARKKGFTHVLLLDQDSIPATDMVGTLKSALSSLEKVQKAAAVGPRYIDPRSSHQSYFVHFHNFRIKRIYCQGELPFIESDFLISSGTLIPLSAIEEIGDMDERLFIDHIDTEWCLRAKAKGYQLFGVCAATMHHTLGEQVKRIWLGQWRHVGIHTPLRNYYYFRNAILLIKENYTPVQWKIIESFRLIGFLLFYTFISPSRVHNLKMIIRGITEGIKSSRSPTSLSD